MVHDKTNIIYSLALAIVGAAFHQVSSVGITCMRLLISCSNPLFLSIEFFAAGHENPEILKFLFPVCWP